LNFNNGLLVGRTLVKTNKDIPLRLMNVSSQPKILYEGTVIAKINPVNEIASPVSGKIHSKTEFPPYLKDLFGLHHPWQKYVKMSAKDVLLWNPVPGTDP
jgi:hypothetical protein